MYSGIVVSLESWNTGSVPGLAQWIKDLALPQLQHGSSDLTPDLGIPYATRWTKKKKKSTQEKFLKYRKQNIAITIQEISYLR